MANFKKHLVTHPQYRIPEEFATATQAWNRAVYLAKVFKEIIKIESPNGDIRKANPTDSMIK